MQAPLWLINLTCSVLLVSFVFYGVVHVPADLDGGDTMIWTLVSRRCARAASILSEYLGFGNRVVLFRRLGPWMNLNIPPEAHPGVQISNIDFDGVPVRQYVPTSLAPQGPSIVWIHGGGWVVSSPESTDGLASELSARLNIKVFSIRYRLAPEYPYPAGFEDCYRASHYFLQNAEVYDVDPERIAIAGSSAGSNLAAAVSLKLRNEHFPRQFKFQVLTVPCLQAFDFQTPSFQANQYDPFLPRDWMIHFWLLYGVGFNTSSALANTLSQNLHTSPAAKRSPLAQRVDLKLVPGKYVSVDYFPSGKSHGDDILWQQLEPVFTDPYFAPLMEANLEKLPEAYILTAQYDVLRDDGILYARRLSKAGVRVTHKHYEKCNHCCLCHYNTIRTSQQALQDIVSFLGTRF